MTASLTPSLAPSSAATTTKALPVTGERLPAQVRGGLIDPAEAAESQDSSPESGESPSPPGTPVEARLPVLAGGRSTRMWRRRPASSGTAKPAAGPLTEHCQSGTLHRSGSAPLMCGNTPVGARPFTRVFVPVEHALSVRSARMNARPVRSPLRPAHPAPCHIRRLTVHNSDLSSIWHSQLG